MSPSQLDSLNTRWMQFSQRALLPSPERLWAAIISLYTEKTRHYHTLDHIADCLNRLDAWPETTANRQHIELAIWFHDIIYDPQRSDNEESSAALLTSLIRGHHFTTEAKALILSTRHKEVIGMEAEAILCDIDIGILGADTTTYNHYAKAIRQEYNFISDEIYCEGRTRVLQNFLCRDSMYQTSHYQNLYHQRSHANIQREILQLQSE